MSVPRQTILDRTRQAGRFTLNEIRDLYGPQVNSTRAVELTADLHVYLANLSEAERITALVCALMMELI